jgi:hypothetical protein
MRAFELDITLLHVTPRVWRRVRVPTDLTLLDLHHAIQSLMNWNDYHLHLFEVAGREYGPPPEEEWEGDDWAGDDAAITVAKAFAESGGPIDYVYDFGNEWRLEITVVAESIATGPVVVECLAGEHAAPPEEGFEAALFSVEATNLRLRRVFPPTATPALPAGPHASAEQQMLANLTLAVLFLGSRENRHGNRQARKTIRAELLERMQEAGLLHTDPRRNSVLLTDVGVERAKTLVGRLAPMLG